MGLNKEWLMTDILLKKVKKELEDKKMKDDIEWESTKHNLFFAFGFRRCRGLCEFE